MHERGEFLPETPEEARERYESLGPVAQVVVREVAKAMEFDREEYEERVTPEVVETARDALFAATLRVTVGTREEFETATEGREVSVTGSANVGRVVWHAPPFGEPVAATFEHEEDAAVGALRRQAFGRIYRDRLDTPTD